MPERSRPASCRRTAPARVALLALLALAAAGAAPAARADRHAGYYYPPPQSSEVYVSRATTLPEASRERRILFVTEITSQMLSNPYPPQVAIYAKGDQAQKMIITSLYSNAYNTLYRMRALLAMLTARARATPIFHEYQVQDIFTYLDLLKLLGFTQLTLTDGDHFAHQITIK